MREESKLNPDSLAENLGRFTPDSTGFDRDALLFEAGRASAGRRRLWPVLTGLLALAQAATLMFFLTRAPDPMSPTVVVVKSVPDPRDKAEPTPAANAVEPSLWSYRRAAMTGDIADLPPMNKDDAGDAPERVLTVLSISKLPPID